LIDVIIIGNGPAGISAALYARRGGLRTLVIGRDNGSLAKADKIENYFGFAQPVSGEELINDGIVSAKRLGVDVITDEVIGMQYNGNIIIKTQQGQYEALSAIIATGITRNAPKIKGLAQFEGKGVSYCAVCDGFFYRGKDVCVIGEGSYAAHEAAELLPIVNTVTIATNGADISAYVPDGVKVITEKITEVKGAGLVESIEFENGETLNVSGIFIAVGAAGSTDLAKKVGAQIDGNKIIVDDNMATNVPGLYAAGDCTAGMLQISKAVYDGAKAGTEVIKYVRKQKATK